MRERKPVCPCFDVDCVINFWQLAGWFEDTTPEELFYQMWPEEDFDEVMPGNYAIVDCYEKITYMGEDEVRETWETVRFYIEDCGYRFYDKVMFIF